jgi:hypothetical protein
MSARCHLTQRVNAYQPRVQPWETDRGHACGVWDGGYACALKERRIVRARVTARARLGDATTCGMVSRGDLAAVEAALAAFGGLEP